MKYRRLKTLLKKTNELSRKCGISLNLLVKDRKYNKITEYHTNDEQMTVKNIRMQLVGGNGQMPSTRLLRIVSVNISEKYKNKMGGSVGSSGEENEQDSEDEWEDEDDTVSDKDIDLESEKSSSDIQEGQFDVKEGTDEEGIKKFSEEEPPNTTIPKQPEMTDAQILDIPVDQDSSENQIQEVSNQNDFSSFVEQPADFLLSYQIGAMRLQTPE